LKYGGSYFMINSGLWGDLKEKYMPGLKRPIKTNFSRVP